MVTLALKNLIHDSPVDRNSKVVASVIALVTTMVVSQDKASGLQLKMNYAEHSGVPKG